MATASTGWKCTHSASITSSSNTSVTITVTCYWQNSGWTYNINNVSAWVYCNGVSHQVKSSGSINTTGSTIDRQQCGSYSFTISKGTAAKGISCYAKITSNSSYVSGTKSSSSTSVSVPALPSYTVAYNANGGSGAPGSQTKWYGSNLTLSGTQPSRTGHNFAGWATSAGGGVSYYPGSTYTSNSGITLYAVWTPHTYTVAYNANGGSGAPENQTKTYGVNLTLSGTRPTRTNYNFLGWSTSSGGGVVYNPGSTYTSNSGVTLYAVWQLAYAAPRISGFSAQRCNSAGTVSESGTYAKVSFSWSTDRTVSSIVIQWRSQSSSTWSEGGVSTLGTSGNVSQVVGSNTISAETTYIIRCYVSDSGGTTYSTEISLGTIKFPIDVKSGGTGVAFGKVAENANLVDFGWLARFNMGLQIIQNGVTSSIQNANSSYTHHNTDASVGHWFNKHVYVAGNVYAGSSYNRRLAYYDELAWGNITEKPGSFTPSSHQHNYSVWTASQYHATGWIGFYNAYGGTRKGWIGHDGGTNFNIINETGGIVYVGSGLGLPNATSIFFNGIGYVYCNTGGPTYVGVESNRGGTYLNLRGNNVRLYAHTGGVYVGASGSTAVTSDRNLKYDIENISSKYLAFFSKLKPVTYKYVEGNRKRPHIGFIAQDVEQALINSGLTTSDFAGILIDYDVEIDPDENENGHSEKYKFYDKLYSLRYEEFIALNTHMIKKNIEKIEEQQKQIDTLTNQVQELTELVLNLTKQGSKT